MTTLQAIVPDDIGKAVPAQAGREHIGVDALVSRTFLYPATQELAVDIRGTVEFYHRKDPDPASRRAKCSRWSGVFPRAE